MQASRMDLEDQWLTREQAIDQRDVHRKAADDWLSRMALAILAGNGAGLVAIANSKTVVDGGLPVRLSAMVVVALFLFGVAASFLAIASQRIHHVTRSWYFAKRARSMDFDTHFAPNMSQSEASEYRALAAADVASTDSGSRYHTDAAEKYLTRSMWASVLGVLALAAVLLLAPRAQPPTSVPVKPPAVVASGQAPRSLPATGMWSVTPHSSTGLVRSPVQAPPAK